MNRQSPDLDRKLELFRALRDYVLTRKEVNAIHAILLAGGWTKKDEDFWVSPEGNEFPVKAAAKIELSKQISDETILTFCE